MRSAVASERPVYHRTGADEGFPGNKFRDSGTQETMEGDEAIEMSGVLSEA